MDNTAITCACTNTEQNFNLSQITNIIDFYKGKEGSLIQVLHLAQEINGCLPLEVQKFISHEMGVPLSEIAGVISFYSFFTPTPKGRHIIRICMGTACYVRGGKRIVQALEAKLRVRIGGTTADEMYTLEIARCIGACGLAPAIMIDDDVHKQVNVNRLDHILQNYRERRVKK